MPKKMVKKSVKTKKRASKEAAKLEAKEAEQDAPKSKNNKFRKDKPWDNDTIDHWKPVTISKADMPKKGLMLEESSFSTLFPQYREQYLKTVWPDVKNLCNEFDLKAELDLVEGSMTVKTTRKTWDPYAIIKSRDLLKLLARSVPYPQAAKIMEDEMICDIIKTSGMLRSKERFVKRRQRLVGPNGSTLKAIELLTNCFVMVQGQTVSVMGTMKGCKQCRRIVEDCMQNIHPIYHIKELMIRRELEKDPELKNENWERFLPHFKKRNVQRKKVIRKKKSGDIFPPQQTPRKEDLLMETGEYFLDEQEREQRKRIELYETQKAKSAENRRERAKAYEAPSDATMKAQKKKVDAPKESAMAMAERLKEKAEAKKSKKVMAPQDLLL